MLFLQTSALLIFTFNETNAWNEDGKGKRSAFPFTSGLMTAKTSAEND